MAIPTSGAISFADFYGAVTGGGGGGGVTCTECANQIPNNFTYNTATAFSGVYDTEHSNFALDTVSGKILASYTSTMGGTSIVAVTRTGNAFTNGTPIALTVYPVDVIGKVHIAWVKSTGDPKFVIAYNLGGSGIIRTGTVSGDTITLGATFTFSTTLPAVSEIDIQGDPHNDDKFLMAYTEKVVGVGRGSWDSYPGRIRAGSISGTTITLGTVKNLNDGDATDNNHGTFCDQINFFVRHDPHTAGKFMICHANGWNYNESNNGARFYFIMLRSGDISGTTLSWHNTDRSDDEANHSGSANYQICGFEYLTGDKYVITDRNDQTAWVVVGTFDYTQGASAGGTTSHGPHIKFIETTIEPLFGIDNHSFTPANDYDDSTKYAAGWKAGTYGAISNPLTLAVCPLHTGDDIFVIGARPWLGYDYGEEFLLYTFKVTGTNVVELVTPAPRRLDNSTIGALGSDADGVPQLDFKLLPAEGQTHTMVFMTREQIGTWTPTTWATSIPDNRAKLRTIVLHDD